MLNLITDPLIRAQVAGQFTTMTLPQVFAELCADRITSFPALRPHQRSAWHMFLVQLGALALHKAAQTDIPKTDDHWASLLRGLTGSWGDDPWSLVVEDLSRPAFLQSPVPEGTLSAYKSQVATPDALDVLITSKNFDLKECVAVQNEPDDWVFSLLSLQTMEGFLGAGNYGIARMNGGFSARPFLGPAPIGFLGAHVINDIKIMLEGRERLLEEYPHYAASEGLGLVWMSPWDGKKSLNLREIDPWFIEICRRVRFVGGPKDTLMALTCGTKVARIEAKQLNGVTGDFWAPVNQTEAKAMSLDARGFSVKVLINLLFGSSTSKTFALPPSFTALQNEQEDMQLVCRGIARGQGKTEGYYERTVPLKGKLKRSLLSPSERETAGTISEAQLKEVGQIASSLRFACAVAAEGGSGEKPARSHYDAATPYLTRFDDRAEAVFFACLSDRLEHGPEAKAPYLRDLIEVARGLLEEAVETILCPTLRRPRARVRAESAFWASLWGQRSVLADDKALIMEKTDVA